MSRFSCFKQNKGHVPAARHAWIAKEEPCGVDVLIISNRGTYLLNSSGNRAGGVPAMFRQAKQRLRAESSQE